MAKLISVAMLCALSAVLGPSATPSPPTPAQTPTPTLTRLMAEVATPTATDQPLPAPPQPTGAPTRIPPQKPRAQFIEGYLAYGGVARYLPGLLAMIDEGCEYDSWLWRGDSAFISVMQFHPQSWRRATELTGLSDPYNLYHVGAATAVWAKLVGPEPPGGWACYHTTKDQ